MNQVYAAHISTICFDAVVNNNADIENALLSSNFKNIIKREFFRRNDTLSYLYFYTLVNRCY